VIIKIKLSLKKRYLKKSSYDIEKKKSERRDSFNYNRRDSEDYFNAKIVVIHFTIK
jgi:hypothetical protein